MGYDDFLIFSFHFLEAPPDHIRVLFLTPSHLSTLGERESEESECENEESESE